MDEKEYVLRDYSSIRDEKQLKKLFSDPKVTPWLLANPKVNTVTKKETEAGFKHFQEKSYKTIVACDKKKNIIGCVHYSIVAAYIWFLFVDPDCQRNGIGRTLLNHAVQDIKKNSSTKTASLRTRSDNRALLLYKKYGFTFPPSTQNDHCFLFGYYQLSNNPKACDAINNVIEFIQNTLQNDKNELNKAYKAIEKKFKPHQYNELLDAVESFTSDKEKDHCYYKITSLMACEKFAQYKLEKMVEINDTEEQIGNLSFLSITSRMSGLLCSIFIGYHMRTRYLNNNTLDRMSIPRSLGLFFLGLYGATRIYRYTISAKINQQNQELISQENKINSLKQYWGITDTQLSRPQKTFVDIATKNKSNTDAKENSSPHTTTKNVNDNKQKYFVTRMLGHFASFSRAVFSLF